MNRLQFPTLVLAATLRAVTFAQAFWQPTKPGTASVTIRAETVTLQNAALRAEWSLGPKARLSLTNAWTRSKIEGSAEPFRVVLRTGESIPASAFQTEGVLRTRRISAQPNGLRTADHSPGYEMVGTWLHPHTGLRAVWRAWLRDGANYFQTELTLTPTRGDVDVQRVVLVDFPSQNARVVGTVAGSPLMVGRDFMGLAHPMAVNTVAEGRAQGAIERKLPLHAGQSTAYTAVFGVSPVGQERRAFGAFVERERARPYAPFLHYNSWYDIGYFTPYTQTDALDRIHTFGEELSVKRGVKLSSFMFDDGWDDPSTVWEFNSGFPNGFAPLRDEAAKYGAAPGMWLSPWGGYGDPHARRIETGRRLGYEIDDQGYALSGPKYFDRFREVCLKLVRDYGINQFKFDGTGSPDKQYPGSPFGSDFEAAISLIEELREANPKLFINLTTGTWPSPFWSRYADSIWRGGNDHSFAGVGTWRQKWITYRDGDTYHGVVQKGPFYPLNSLMLHGLIYAAHAHNLNTDPDGDFRQEVRSYFATGTQLQEMYLTPSLLSPQNWDDLAEAAKWSQRNQDALRDTHWVGGDPLKGEVYGWSGLAKDAAILTLRNPSDHPQAFSVELGRILEVPGALQKTVTMRSPWHDEAVQAATEFPLAQAKVVVLAPFEVRTWQGSLPAASLRARVTREPRLPQIAETAKESRIALIGTSLSARDLAQELGSSTNVVRFDSPADPRLSAFRPTGVVYAPRMPDAQVWPSRRDAFTREVREGLTRLHELPSQPKPYLLVESVPDHQAWVANEMLPLLRQGVSEAPDATLIVPADEPTVAVVAEAVGDPRAAKATWRVVSTDSQEGEEGPAANAIDGDPMTYWHTRYSPKNAPYPHEITVDMGTERSLRGFRYVPRQDGGVNGRVAKYAFYVSPDATTWGTPAAEGSFTDTAEPSRVVFAHPVKGRFFRFVALSEVHGGPWASAGEIDVLGTRLREMD